MSCIKESKDLAVRMYVFKILTGLIIKILVNYLTDFHDILCASENRLIHIFHIPKLFA